MNVRSCAVNLQSSHSDCTDSAHFWANPFSGGHQSQENVSLRYLELLLTCSADFWISASLTNTSPSATPRMMLIPEAEVRDGHAQNTQRLTTSLSYSGPFVLFLIYCHMNVYEC